MLLHALTAAVITLFSAGVLTFFLAKDTDLEPLGTILILASVLTSALAAWVRGKP